MKYLLVLSSALALGAPSLAQTTMTSPDGFLSKEGTSFCRYFGPYADGRQQFATGDLEGKKAMLSEVAYRLDNRDHTTDQTRGRSWTDVTLYASECPIDALNVKLVAEWTLNSTTTPTMVFSGAVEWPTQVGYPSASSSVPAAWGGRKNRLRFPFSAPWSYSGKGGLLLDYAFTGGTLADNGDWSGGSYVSYYLDGVNVPVFASARTTYFPSTTKCNDSAHSHSAGAYTSVSATAYALNYSTASLRGKLGVGFFSGYTAPSAPVITVIGGAGIPAGVNIGAGCNKLHVDLGKPHVFDFGTAGTGSGFRFATTRYLTWKSSFGGQEMWGQTAWADSKTGRFSLTRSRRGIIADKLPPTVKRGMVYHYDRTRISGFDPTDAAIHLPVMRITYK